MYPTTEVGFFEICLQVSQFGVDMLETVRFAVSQLACRVVVAQQERTSLMTMEPVRFKPQMRLSVAYLRRNLPGKQTGVTQLPSEFFLVDELLICPAKEQLLDGLIEMKLLARGLPGNHPLNKQLVVALLEMAPREANPPANAQVVV